MGVQVSSTDSNIDLRQVDPFKIAYLRSGKREVIKLYIFDLVQRRLLTVIRTGDAESKKFYFKCSRENYSREDLSEAERIVLDQFKFPLEAKFLREIFLPRGLLSGYRKELMTAGLLSKNVRFNEVVARIIRRLVHELPEISAEIGLTALATRMERARRNLERYLDGKLGRLTNAGRAFLKKLEDAINLHEEMNSDALIGGSDWRNLIGISTFGFKSLNSTEYEYLIDAFRKGDRHRKHEIADLYP
jgi:hypothetical protein